MFIVRWVITITMLIWGGLFLVDMLHAMHH